ncbi:hypothetical protein GLOIN_2v1511218 [Rhizophagus irregularis DAOM 181602=DAOM 197198]|uniref:Uncharacterized protein n=1 Tax=Rhizophagus irregularis (strain DAOM 181602 / DAOM 197198 / MUCL 43194) TaxID=747089 RepID=A0A2P4QUE0_RHIID|nr:hypothetical protein GLOIN_2v1511218 [Rhizophagus irregularis DAOM 181602=DAOM 197198]POG81168.1 hypothetical protein GLOIN_2v1511218 [Rhizophagus irregularis DAOM 181602=DAOM 197198]|eukprot:XP_025188034.1 hypothetical protein GLOIN_2v1511218 [Rhizophagus irregularis DAOM 181602=DAOM 197198]
MKKKSIKKINKKVAKELVKKAVKYYGYIFTHSIHLFLTWMMVTHPHHHYHSLKMKLDLIVFLVFHKLVYYYLNL